MKTEETTGWKGMEVRRKGKETKERESNRYWRKGWEQIGRGMDGIIMERERNERKGNKIKGYEQLREK